MHNILYIIYILHIYTVFIYIYIYTYTPILILARPVTKMWYYRDQYESGHFNDFLSSKDVKKCKCPKYVRSCEKCNVNKARNCFK